MNTKNNLLNRMINKLYNNFFIFKNNIQIYKEYKINTSSGTNQNTKHSNDLENVWLLNLLKLYKIFTKTHRPINYNFLDVGCGNGIPIIYSHKRFNFKSYQGFDFISDRVNNTKKNITNYLIKNHSEAKITKFNIFYEDASSIKLDLDKYFIFMFNPFDSIIMNNFMKNNILLLRKSNSVIAYSNYNYLQTILEYNPKNVTLNKRYKLALIEF
jgi:hypothetical protein